MDEVDLVIIGSGPAGEKHAAWAAWSGKRVISVDAQALPGGAPVSHERRLPGVELEQLSGRHLDAPGVGAGADA